MGFTYSDEEIEEFSKPDNRDIKTVADHLAHLRLWKDMHGDIYKAPNGRYYEIGPLIEKDEAYLAAHPYLPDKPLPKWAILLIKLGIIAAPFILIMVALLDPHISINLYQFWEAMP